MYNLVKIICYTLFISFFVFNSSHLVGQDTWNQVIDQESISLKSRKITQLRAIQAVKQFERKAKQQQAKGKNLSGKILWAEAEMVTYEDGTQAILTPVDSREMNRSVLLVSILDKKGQVQEPILLDMQPNSKKSRSSVGFSGYLAFSTLDNQYLLSGNYRNGELVSQPKSAFAARKGSSYWTCVSRCVLDSYSSEIGKWCKKQCVKCFDDGKTINCVACGACIVGGAIKCLINCK